MTNKTIYKSIKVKNNTLMFGKHKLYTFADDVLTQAKLESDIIQAKKHLTPFVKTAISEVDSYTVERISPTYFKVELLYSPNHMEPNRQFKTFIYVDTFNGILLSH
jgi:hypothetical protein